MLELSLCDYDGKSAKITQTAFFIHYSRVGRFPAFETWNLQTRPFSRLNAAALISCRLFEGGLVKPKIIIAIAGLLALGTAERAPAQSAEAATDKKLDAIFSGVTAPDAPRLAALVRKNGRTVFERGYGVRDLRSKAKIDAHTNFRLASFTKQFTAMAAMLLVRDGKLGYDETLTQIFPDFPEYGKAITIRNLLNHTSGLPDYEDLMEATEKTKGPVWTPARLRPLQRE